MGSSTLSYDASGNLTQDDLYKYKYDAENHLVEVDLISGTVVATYTLDGNGLRVVKVAGTARTFYIYAGTQLLSEFTDTAGTTYTAGTTPGQAPSDSLTCLLYQHGDHPTRIGRVHMPEPWGTRK